MRLILDPPGGGAWNMAVDEVLLADAAERGQATLRFYQWSEPTLSLGYFQAHAQRVSHPASRPCPLVRRTSGGGAIVHDAELTYSLAVPISRQQRTAAELYTLMHASLVETLVRLGVEAHRHGHWRDDEVAQAMTACQPFLCFQRRTEGDVLCGNVKIAGSAQRRRGAAVLQHGSVLLRRSAAAPELAGIAEVSGQAILPEALASSWLQTLAEQSLGPWRQSPLLGSLQEAAQRLCREKYEASAWNLRR